MGPLAGPDEKKQQYAVDAVHYVVSHLHAAVRNCAFPAACSVGVQRCSSSCLPCTCPFHREPLLLRIAPSLLASSCMLQQSGGAVPGGTGGCVGQAAAGGDLPAAGHQQ